MKTIKRPTFRQYFAAHSNVVVARDGVRIKFAEPFGIEVTCMLCNANGQGCVEICVSFKRPKGFKIAFGLASVEEVKGITRKEVLRVWRDQLLEL